MLELMQTYSITDIITFLVVFALSIKGVVSFWDWGKARLKQAFEKDGANDSKMTSLNNKFDALTIECQILKEYYAKVQTELQSIVDKINCLIDSDKDDIKSFITREHHYFCYQKKWIDNYSIDCIEKRYKHYKDEGGNSFILDLMEDLRKLPKNPPNDVEAHQR